MTDIRPIIATLTVDKEAQRRFQRLRDRYYPASRVPAHITLFRHLPGRAPEELIARIGGICADTAPFMVRAEAPMGLANGVALKLISAQLHSLRKRIAETYMAHLANDDRKPFEPHMTIQHRVTRRRARRTLGAVRASFTPFEARAEGVALWRYVGGPWEALADLPLGS